MAAAAWAAGTLVDWARGWEEMGTGKCRFQGQGLAAEETRLVCRDGLPGGKELAHQPLEHTLCT